MLFSRFILPAILLGGVQGLTKKDLHRKFTGPIQSNHRPLQSSHIFSVRGGSDSGHSDITEPSASDVDTMSVGEGVIGEAAVEPSSSQVSSVEISPVVATDVVEEPKTKTSKINPKLENAIERTGPAVLLLGLLYASLKIFGENALLFIVPLMQLGMYAETTGIIEAFHGAGDVEIKIEKWWWFLTVFASTSLRSLGVTLGMNTTLMDLACFAMVSVGLVVAVCGMASHSNAGPEMFRKYLGEVASFHFALLFLVGQSSFWIKTIQSFGMGWVLFPAFLVIVNDTMAYVFGVLVGKHKLLPRLSPKKTVEGFVGAGFSTVAVAVPLLKLFIKNSEEGSKFLSVMGLNNGNLLKHALALGFYTSLVAPFGGFLASAVKRAHGAKDFGTLIPGHGGVVDRFDCQVVTAPFVYLYLKCFHGEPAVVPEVLEVVTEAVTEAMVQ